ncbi:hypothetical protein EGT74_06390 [Chitinophaga lutea]|uniref:Uncharacterized protein n=1 Tax=Chitinophaga lutea TaxID=2488634 RepID=A0A3N4Q0M7_9BACT|nr:hypothetical protein [Chitinophaga lutea]RPE13155.1 hypothetical protein EGT74_06390 [Chitinophaga lutea]
MEPIQNDNEYTTTGRGDAVGEKAGLPEHIIKTMQAIGFAKGDDDLRIQHLPGVTIITMQEPYDAFSVNDTIGFAFFTVADPDQHSRLFSITLQIQKGGDRTRTGVQLRYDHSTGFIPKSEMIKRLHELELARRIQAVKDERLQRRIELLQGLKQEPVERQDRGRGFRKF